MAIKLYDSKAWLKRKYLIEKKTPVEIAKQCGASRRTIYSKLKEFDLLKK
jgi:transcriptional antiterminator